MDLRVTEESDTYVYATSPLRVGGLDPEDFIMFALPMALMKTAEWNPLLNLAVAGFCLWLYKKLTAEQPSGFLPVAVGLAVARLLAKPAIRKIPPVYKLLHLMIKLYNRVWISSGLLPLPNYCDRYER